MQKETTIAEIVESYLRDNKYRYLTEGIIEKECEQYGIDKFDIYHSGSSYSRLFRTVRNQIDLDIKIVESINGEKPRWKTWIVTDKYPQFSLFEEVV